MSKAAIGSIIVAALSAIAEAIGFAQMFQGGTATTAVIAFVFFSGSMIALALSLQRRINELEGQKTSLHRRRKLRAELEKFLREYKDLMDTATNEQVVEVDRRLELFCATNEEMTGRYGEIVTGAHITKTAPTHLRYGQQQVWFKCQTRTYHLAEIIKELRD